MQTHQQSNEDLKLPPIHINRNMMIFRATQNIDKSLTIKNSSDNISISQSMPDAESSDKFQAINRASSNSSYINKINQSGVNLS